MAAPNRRFLTRVFDGFARWTCNVAGKPVSFVLAVLVIVAWITTGPLFGYSDTWQLVINTGTTIVTFLMVFLIQHTQNRDATALDLKIDELIRAVKPADNKMLNVEKLDDEDLERLHTQYLGLAAKAKAASARRRHRRKHSPAGK